MRAVLRFFWPVVLLAIFTGVLVREIGFGVVLALEETTRHWKALKRNTHPSIER